MKKLMIGMAMLAMVCGGCCSYSPVSLQVASPVGLPCGVKDTNIGLNLLWGINDNVIGLDIGGVNWVDDHMAGLQIGLINRAEKLHGVQLGLLNFQNSDVGIGFLPFINLCLW